MNDFQSKVANSRNLKELAETLNEYCIDENNGLKLEESVNLDSLPTFGKAPDKTLEVFSWDEESLLIQGTSCFEIISRD